MTITVSSGGLTKRVKASNPYEAVKLFIEKYRPASLGVIASCHSKDLDDEYYVSTERVLRDLGRWQGPGIMSKKRKRTVSP